MRELEHVIRLRGGWDCVDLDDKEPHPERISLPARWGSAAPRRLRLIRRFGRPAASSDNQQLLLRLDRVPGLDSVSLNGQILSVSCPDDGPVEVPLPKLFRRNQLVLEVVLPELQPGDRGHLPAWGEVALLIRCDPT